MKTFWGWFWFVLGVLYFFFPLIATFEFSLRAKKGVLSLLAYQRVLQDPQFVQTFSFSLEMARADHPGQPDPDRADGLLDPPAAAAASPGGRVHHTDAVRDPGDRAGLRVDPRIQRRPVAT